MQNKLRFKSSKITPSKLSHGELPIAGVGNIPAATPKGFSRRLHRKQAAEFLGVSLSWLDKARISGLGPVFVKMGGRVLYDSRDLEAFIDGNRHSSTSEQY
jgi:helix-turn-helix protein